MMRKNLIKGILFDLDGTLADTLPLCIQAFRRAVKPLSNRVFTDEDIIATFGPSEEGTIHALIPNSYEQGINEYIRYYEELHSLCPEPFEGIVELLDVVKRQGIRLGLVTGKGPRSTSISLEYFRLTDYFERIETGWIHGPRKVDGIRSILAQWVDLTHDQVWYVGDAPSDITAAKEAGIRVVGAAWAPTTNTNALTALQPDELFTSITAFNQWVRQMMDAQGSGCIDHQPIGTT